MEVSSWTLDVDIVDWSTVDKSGDVDRVVYSGESDLSPANVLIRGSTSIGLST